MIRRVKVLVASESGWKPCDATEDDLTVSPRGNSRVWAEMRWVPNQISDGGKGFGELDNGDDWAKSGGWRTIGGQECVQPLKNEKLTCGWADEIFNRAGRRDDVGSRCKSRHVTDQPAKPLILALRRLLHSLPPALSRSGYAVEIADSTTLFDPKRSPIPSGTLKRNVKCTRRIKHQTDLLSGTELPSCDATSKLGKSERGAVREGSCWLGLGVFFLLSRHAVRLSARADHGTPRDAPFNPGQS